MDRECTTCGRPIDRGERGDKCSEHKLSPQTDLFNEQRVTVQGNPVLEQAANIVLQVMESHLEVLQYDTVGEVDRAVLAEVLLDAGLRELLEQPEPRSTDMTEGLVTESDLFRDLMVQTGGPRAPESLRRGRQWLVANDYIRLSAAAIRDAAKHQGRIQHAMGGQR